MASLKLRTTLQNLRIVRRSKRNKIRKLHRCVNGRKKIWYIRPPGQTDRSPEKQKRESKLLRRADHCFATKYLSLIPPRARAKCAQQQQQQQQQPGLLLFLLPSSSPIEDAGHHHDDDDHGAAASVRRNDRELLLVSNDRRLRRVPGRDVAGEQSTDSGYYSS